MRLPSLRRWRERRILQRQAIAPRDWAETLAGLPILRDLPAAERQRLHDLTVLFLHGKSVLPVQGLTLSAAQRRHIAAQACYPILNLGLDWYGDWQTLIVYPDEFLKPRRELDADGVMHEWTEIRQGEAWQRGPVVLSWADVLASGLGEGYNVVIHEMAHQLDMLNGEADGFPPLHPAMRAADWRRAFSAAFADLNAQLAGGIAGPIDSYAATSPGECFAVASESFFERPARLQAAYPEVYDQLRRFYRQDPLALARPPDTPGADAAAHQ